jgi:hypothetical protein
LWPDIAGNILNLDGDEGAPLRKGSRRGDQNAELYGSAATRHEARRAKLVDGASSPGLQIDGGTTREVMQSGSDRRRFTEIGWIDPDHPPFTDGRIAIAERARDLRLQVRAPRRRWR